MKNHLTFLPVQLREVLETIVAEHQLSGVRGAILLILRSFGGEIEGRVHAGFPGFEPWTEEEEVRVALELPDDVKGELDAAADRLHLRRSAIVGILLAMYRDQLRERIALGQAAQPQPTEEASAHAENRST